MIRSILLALVLAATGAGLLHVTTQRATPALPPITHAPISKLEGMTVPFNLLLSASAAAISLDAGHPVQLATDTSSISGKLLMDPKNPRIAISIHWRNATVPDEHRFAKITFDVPKQETFVHVFDAVGDIDDFIELPTPISGK
ncbi:MAG: hypothetical protein ORN51_09595 [Akkermansiaceae bacterium]|nr:hypothetical protein [Akkermansiaceae bacterium]